MPRLLDPSNPVSDKAFVSVCFSDSLAWIFAFLVLFIGIYIYLIRGKAFKGMKLPSSSEDGKKESSIQTAAK